MDYLKIVINGYFDLNTRENLDKYFYREFKNAEKDNYSEKEFFDGCNRALDTWKAEFKKKVDKRKIELYQLIQFAEEGKHFREDENGNKKTKELTIEYYENELVNERLDGIGDITYSHNLFPLVRHHLKYNEITFIEKAILMARMKVLKEIKNKLLEDAKEVRPSKEKNTPQQKTLFGFIYNIEDKEIFVRELKTVSTTEKGKSIKAIIDILISNEVLVIGAREFKNFINELTKSFDRELGTYQSIQNQKEIEKAIKDPINIKLLPIINKFKSI